MHGSEESGADAALQLLYELADRDDCVVETLLDNLVIFVIPVQNPDGRVLDQRRNGYGFDLNRVLRLRVGRRRATGSSAPLRSSTSRRETDESC